MIFRPVNAFPSNSINIDATLSNRFSTIIQGGATIVSDYSASIYKSVDFTQVYTTNKQTLPNLLTTGQDLSFEVPPTSGMVNGESYYWILRLYQSIPDIFITKTIVQAESTATQIKVRLHNNIKVGMYISLGSEQRQILSYIKDEKTAIGTITVSSAFSVAPTANTEGKIYSDFVDSLQFMFYAKSTPTLALGAIQSPITSRSFTFKMSYAQAQGVPIKWYRFLLMDKNGITIKDTGKVYSSLLEFKFNAFSNSATYYVQGFAENIDGVVIETLKESFLVSYPSPNIELPPQLSHISADNAIRIDWVADLFAAGRATGAYRFINDFPFTGTNSLEIQTGEVVYDNFSNLPLSTTDVFSLYTDISIVNTTDGKLISLSNDMAEYCIYIEQNSLLQLKDGKVSVLCKILEFEKSGQQVSNVAEDNVAYFWYDDEVWDDSKYCLENKSFEKRFKLTIEADKVYLERSVIS
ncbi:MAG: hypothetical protein RR198_07005 [Oscillospiraceae bacterium]